MRTLSLIIVTFTYLLVGAAIFDALEGPNNEQVKEGLVKLRENLKTKYEMSEDDYKVLEVLIEERKPHKTGPQWKFAGSLYYAFVTLALIGEREVLFSPDSPAQATVTPPPPPCWARSSPWLTPWWAFRWLSSCSR